AQMDIGVVTQDATARAVADRNAKQSAQLIDQLKTVIRAAEIKTINYSVNPNYRYPKDAPPAITGYTATNTIRLDALQIGDVPKIIDIATRAGASNINRLNFTLSNENRLRAEALSQAAKQARDAAQALGSALSLRIGKVLRVEEGQPVIISPLRQTEFALAKTQGAAALPVEPGNIEVHVNVDVTFELTP
ncbi:MAG TPA: SIMPL domain-containing protein, partial [Bryobacteraceae bacterium]|nr:SIMPL domain-containing protein [Bryobacteraceae bacterium]